MLELKQLRMFVGVAEERHFGRAAARLFVSQPALSRQIISLERSLGRELFERGPHGVRLTVAGHALLADARELIARAELLERSIRTTPFDDAGNALDA